MITMTTRFEPHETTSTPAAAWISLKLDQYPTLKIKSPLSREFYWIFESGPAAYELEKQFQSGAEGARALLSRFHELKKQVAQKRPFLFQGETR